MIIVLLFIIFMAHSCTNQEPIIENQYKRDKDSLMVYLDDGMYFLREDGRNFLRDAISPDGLIKWVKEPYFVIKDTSVIAAVNSSISAAKFDTLETTYSPRLKTLTPEHPLYKSLSKPFYKNAIDCWFAVLYYHDDIIDTIGFGGTNKTRIQINNLTFRDSALYNRIHSLCITAIDSVSNSASQNDHLLFNNISVH